MQTYELRLESPGRTSNQHRIVTVGADSPEQAAQHALAIEDKLAAFTLRPPAKDVWEDPLGHGGPHAHIDLSLWDAHDPEFRTETAKHTSYNDAKRAADARIEDWTRRAQFDKGGNIARVGGPDGPLATTLGRRSLARLAAHNQTEPFEVVDTRLVPQQEVEAWEFVRQARALAENDPAKWQEALAELRALGIPLNVTAGLYGVPAKNRADGTANGAISWKPASDTFKAMLASNSYAIAIDTDDFQNDVTNEVTGTGWSAGGVTLTSLSSLYDSTSHQARFDAGDIAATGTTLTGVRYVVVYKSTGTNTTSPLVSFVNAGADVSTTAGTLGVTWDATGVWNDDVA